MGIGRNRVETTVRVEARCWSFPRWLYICSLLWRILKSSFVYARIVCLLYVYFSMSGELSTRRDQRERKKREEKKRARKIKEEENRLIGIYPTPNIDIESFQDFPEWQPEQLFKWVYRIAMTARCHYYVNFLLIIYIFFINITLDVTKKYHSRMYRWLRQGFGSIVLGVGFLEHHWQPARPFVCSELRSDHRARWNHIKTRDR